MYQGVIEMEHWSELVEIPENFRNSYFFRRSAILGLHICAVILGGNWQSIIQLC